MSATLQSFGEAAANPQSLGEETVTAASTKTEGKELGAEFEEHYALADFTAEDASQVSFKRGDKVFVKTKDQSGKQKKLFNIDVMNTHIHAHVAMQQAYQFFGMDISGLVPRPIPILHVEN